MHAEAVEVPLAAILPWREAFRARMQCQILQDSFHARAGWTRSFLLRIGAEDAGYGAVVVGGPWDGQAVVFEFHVGDGHRGRVLELFDRLLAASGATGIRAQSNDPLLMTMLGARGRALQVEKVVFADASAPVLEAPQECRLISLSPDGGSRRFAAGLGPGPTWGLERAGEIVATGGILWHYNRPYGDLFMEVAAPHRRQGLGAYLVQQLRRICSESGGRPCARCDPDNLASQRTLQKAGLVPVAVLVNAGVGPGPLKEVALGQASG